MRFAAISWVLIGCVNPAAPADVVPPCLGAAPPEECFDSAPIDSETSADAMPSDTAAADTTPADTATDTAPALDRSKCVADPDKVGLVSRAVPGKATKYLSYIPATYDRMKPTSLLIALHGAGDVASNYLNVVWKGNADKRDFIVIAPDGSCAAGPGNTWCMDDNKSIAAMIDDIGYCYSIDPRRRVIDGFSAGGVMAYAMGLQGATLFAGISVSAANLGSAEAVVGKKLLPAPWKIPVSHHHGTMDMNFPIDTARAGRDRLEAAGHKVYFHEFGGGHTTTPAFALIRWDDLAPSTAP